MHYGIVIFTICIPFDHDKWSKKPVCSSDQHKNTEKTIMTQNLSLRFLYTIGRNSLFKIWGAIIIITTKILSHYLYSHCAIVIPTEL